MIIWDKVWADLWSNKVRTILAVLSVAAGVFAIGAIFGMADQMLSGMDRAHQAVFPSHINMYLMGDIDRRMADSLEKIAGVEAVELLNTATVRYKAHAGQEWERADMIARLLMTRSLAGTIGANWTTLLRYYAEVIRGVFLRGSGLEVLWPQGLIMLIYGICLLGLATLRFKKSLD